MVFFLLINEPTLEVSDTTGDDIEEKPCKQKIIINSTGFLIPLLPVSSFYHNWEYGYVFPVWTVVVIFLFF